MISGLLVDIDGVLTVSWRPIPGAPEALSELRRRHLPIRFATNTTTRSRAEVAALLGEAGMEAPSDDILTAPVATAAYLRRHHPGARCLLVNNGDLSADMEGIDFVTDGAVDVVVFGGAGPSFTYDAINRAFGALLNGAALVAMHRNLSWRTTAGIQVDTGAFLAGLEEAAGVEATVVGKPAAAFFEAGLDALGLAPLQVAMVGDDVANDVLAAQRLGITGVLVRTGKFRPEALSGLSSHPDAIVDSFAGVPVWLEEGTGAGDRRA